MVIGSGGDLIVRQLWPADGWLIRAAFGRLSVDSRYLRYGIPVRDPDAVLGWVTQLDGVCHAAVGAVLSATGVLVGGARYATATDGTYAEVAEVVVDAWQGQRIGPWLLRELIELAQQSGAAPLRASVLPENRRAQRMLRTFGAWKLRGRRDGFLEYEFSSSRPDAGGCHPPAT